VSTKVEQVVTEVKPHLRGWLHAGMAPVAVVLGIVLIVLSPPQYRWAAALYSLTAVMLFGTSAVYHRFNWGPRAKVLLKRLDHSNIFLIIAGTYTPFALLLPSDQARRMLIIVWSGAFLGVLFRVFWTGAPRWLYVPAYLMLGWVAVFYFGPLLQHAGAAVMTWVVIGGALYSIGAIVYGTKRPNLSPRWFGFHEVFHTLTILAFTAHFVAASLALTGPTV
jgi:hemolysin III